MAIEDDIKRACILIENGYLNEAKKFFTDLLANSSDEILERISQNRLEEINRSIKNAKQCLSLSLESIIEDNGFIVCQIQIAYKEPHVKNLIESIFKNSHKLNYKDTSSITISHPASQKISVDLEGLGKDLRCEWCKLFRKNIVYHIGRKNLIRDGHCLLGIED